MILGEEQLKCKANELRKQMIEMYSRAGTGHITSGFSCMELLVVLYYGGILKYKSDEPEWENRDYFVMSKGHASTALYPILADLGFFRKEELNKCLKKDGLLGICLNKMVPGVEISSGSLAIGFGISTGIAMGKKMERSDSLIVALLGDAECYEGAIWETAMFASHNNLNNLIAIVDRNYLACTDFTENMLELEPFAAKWEAFGWETVEIDGHDINEIQKALNGIRSFKRRKPLVIIADTVKGKGVPSIENIPLMHGAALTGEAAKKAVELLDDINCVEED